MNASLRVSLIVLLSLALGPATKADEGVWPFNMVPKAAIAKRYHVELSDAWLKQVQLASVRFNNGGSGSFVGPGGLVLTNHHVALDTLSKVSTAQKDYAADGFYASTQAEEIKAPDLELNVLVSIDDVTANVNAAVKPEMAPGAALTARRAAIAAIEQESTAATGLRSDVVTLYQGAQYHLYRYKKYTDVRLVFAPEFGIAFFGGDPDNFTFPRYCLDAALFRVYENGKPAEVAQYLSWSRSGARDGEPIFVSGHPGTTQRLNTVAHLEYLRDVGLPLVLKYLDRSRAALLTYSGRGAEQARQAKDQLFSIENSLKALRGEEAGLQDPAVMAKKRQAEERLRTAIAADPQTLREYGDAWTAIATARKGVVAYSRERALLENGWGFESRLFRTARVLVRMAAEDQKPNAERLPEFTEARRPSVELELFSPAPLYPELENATLGASLAFLAEELGHDHPAVKKVLDGKSPSARAAELVDGSRLGDIATRKALAANANAIETSTDSMIALATAIDPEARAVRKRYEDEVVGVERVSYAKIAQAVFATQGTAGYPDATFTLRLSYGAVRGYQENRRTIPPFTDFAGLYGRAAQHRHQPPYELPRRWADNKAQLNLKTPFDFVSTADIIGGNSGSPVVNARGEVVGLIFDGNIQSLVGNFIYDETQNRAIAVDSRAIIEALRKLYGAGKLADELTQASGRSTAGK